MGSTWNLKRLVSCLLWGSFLASTYAQEQSISNFVDYLQPMRDHQLYKSNLDSTVFYDGGLSRNFGSTQTTVSGYSGSGSRISGWPVDGTSEGSCGFEIVGFQSQPHLKYLDLNFLYNAESGAPKKFRIDLMAIPGGGGELYSIGNTSNGGIIDLVSSGSWQKAFARRENLIPSGGLAAQFIRVVAILDGGSYPSFGTYNRNAGIVLDNIRLSSPSRLTGLYRVDGSSNNLSTILFNATGTALSSANWISSLASGVQPIKIFGKTSFNETAGSGSSFSNFIIKSSGSWDFVRRMSLAGTTGGTYIGSGVAGNLATDRYFGINADTNFPRVTHMFRQVTGSTYSHYIRKGSNGLYSGDETSVNLGGEQIVAIADINGDGMDDFVTRSGSSLNARIFQSYTGSGSSLVTNLATAFQLSTYGYLKCDLVADLNNDGFEDLVLRDSVSGDVYSLICTPTSGTLDWIFALNADEKVIAAADADNDGFVDIYCKRDFSSTVGKLTIRKLAKDGLSVSTYDLACEYANATYTPIAIGDINGDGSADIVFSGNNAPYYSLFTSLVNPANRNTLSQSWITDAGASATLQPIFTYPVL